MIDRELKERVKFKQSIDRLKKCHLKSNGSFQLCERKNNYFPLKCINHSLLGKIFFCKICKGIIFRGNKQ
jgi:hypothetical protein